jgi:hypothetical protein
MATYDEMKTRVGRKLGIVTDTITLSAEDAEIIAQALMDVQEQIHVLAQRPALNVEYETATEYADALAAITAASLVDEYGTPEPKRSQLLMLGKLGTIPPSPTQQYLIKLLQSPLAKLQTTTDVTIV